MLQIKNRFTGVTILKVESLQDADSQGVDLRDVDLRDADLRGVDLRDADLWGANLRGADLRGADLRGVNLRGVNLRHADLQGADLQGANLVGADLQGVDLRGAAVVIAGLEWCVYVTNGHIRIGCQSHPLITWENFTDGEISEMAKGALEFWNVNKSWMIATCKSLTKGD